MKDALQMLANILSIIVACIVIWGAITVHRLDGRVADLGTQFETQVNEVNHAIAQLKDEPLWSVVLRDMLKNAPLVSDTPPKPPDAQ